MGGQERHVLSVSLQDDLLRDIDYMYQTSGEPIKRSRAVEEILRAAVPSKSLSVSSSKD